jgi:hypothetical protein
MDGRWRPPRAHRREQHDPQPSQVLCGPTSPRTLNSSVQQATGALVLLGGHSMAEPQAQPSTSQIKRATFDAHIIHTQSQVGRCAAITDEGAGGTGGMTAPRRARLFRSAARGVPPLGDKPQRRVPSSSSRRYTPAPSHPRSSLPVALRPLPLVASQAAPTTRDAGRSWGRGWAPLAVDGPAPDATVPSSGAGCLRSGD